MTRKPDPKQRLDVRLVELGLAPTRQRAQALILAGKVLVNDSPSTKAGEKVPVEAVIRLRGSDHPYVSRGGVKLAGALDSFSVSPEGRVGLDVGASTGGFTQVLLQRGALRVHAVDVGHSQMDWSLRSDPRVIQHEKVNARELTLDQIGERVGMVVIDVSFISLEKVVPALLPIAQADAEWITLIKPQFEVGREWVGKGGIVTSTEAIDQAIARITERFESFGLRRVGLIESPITGTDGNREYLAHWKSK